MPLLASTNNAEISSAPNSPRPPQREKIWIDLDNAPHVPLFAPIIRELRARGHDVVVTAGKKSQVSELLELHGVEAKQVGRNYGKNKFIKVGGLIVRALRILPHIRRERPVLAVSHGSRTVGLVSRLIGRPWLVMMDYEYASKAFISPHRAWVLAPEVIATATVGVLPERRLTYPGIKEDVYVPNFKPDGAIRSRLGLGEDDIVAVLRPPATDAHYHNPEAEVLLREVMRFFLERKDVRIVLLPRSAAQAEELRREWSAALAASRAVIPDHVVDGLNLIWHADLIVSGGGTMNREAAALGMPVYSIFRGTIGAVDRYLAAAGRLVLIESPAEVRAKIRLERRARPASPGVKAAPALASIVDAIERVAAIEAGRLPRGKTR